MSRLFSSLRAIKQKHHQASTGPLSDLVKYPVIAYCTAEEYNLPGIESHFSHLKVTRKSAEIVSVEFPGEGVGKECFFFGKGSIIGWNLNQTEIDALREEIKPFEVKPNGMYPVDKEYFDFAFISPEKNMNLVDSEIRPSESNVNNHFAKLEHSAVFPDANLIVINSNQSHSDVSLDKMAFSHGIGNSVKLAVLESQLETFIDSIKNLPDMLLAGKKLRLTRREILGKVGEILKFRAHLNLHSGLLETPDVYWNNVQLERNYDEMSGFLDVKKRVAILNKKLDYANDIAALLREHLAEKHSLSLEWCIILLILIEVLFQFKLHLWH